MKPKPEFEEAVRQTVEDSVGGPISHLGQSTGADPRQQRLQEFMATTLATRVESAKPTTDVSVRSVGIEPTGIMTPAVAQALPVSPASGEVPLGVIDDIIVIFAGTAEYVKFNAEVTGPV